MCGSFVRSTYLICVQCEANLKLLQQSQHSLIAGFGCRSVVNASLSHKVAARRKSEVLKTPNPDEIFVSKYCRQTAGRDIYVSHPTYYSYSTPQGSSHSKLCVTVLSRILFAAPHRPPPLHPWQVGS